MPLRIVRNDIVKMTTDAIVNTANDHATVGTGCDGAVYRAAGYDELLDYRREHIGFVEEGGAFITPGFGLNARYIIHAVSPRFIDGDHGEEEKLRSCYRKSLQLAKENEIRSIAFPLISTGGFGYPKEAGLRIAVDEINAFLFENEMDIFLVVFDERSTRLGENIYPDLETYIDRHYVEVANAVEYIPDGLGMAQPGQSRNLEDTSRIKEDTGVVNFARNIGNMYGSQSVSLSRPEKDQTQAHWDMYGAPGTGLFDFSESHGDKLDERIKHISDTYSEYLMYLIHEKNLTSKEVYDGSIVSKKVFSKIKNNPDYHPNKQTALRLCIGARLNLDEAKDLLARAGYALSPCDKTDIIFSYFIENEIYDIIELDIQLEEHGLPCAIS